MSSTPQDRPRCNAQSGFGLIEIVVVTAVMAAIVASIIPISDLFVSRAFEDETREEMAVLSEGILRYYEDVRTYPPTLSALLVKPVGTTGWMGPYIPYEFTDSSSQDLGFFFDAWTESYLFQATAGALAELRSRGQNRSDETGSGDDLENLVDATQAIRARTKMELNHLNNAIDLYQDNNPSTPLPGTLSELLEELQISGYLPSDLASTQIYSQDEWGQNYVIEGSPPIGLSTEGPPEIIDEPGDHGDHGDDHGDDGNDHGDDGDDGGDHGDDGDDHGDDGDDHGDDGDDHGDDGGDHGDDGDDHGDDDGDHNG